MAFLERHAPPRRPPRRVALVLLCAGAAALAGCGSTRPARETPRPDAPAASANPLVAERRWLQSWFDGTPVRITQRGGGPIELEVPLEFCFEPGRSVIRPALAAVLDKVAESLRRLPQARVELLAAPADASAKAAPALAQQRGARVRERLRASGVAAARLAAATPAATPAVRLRIGLGSDA